jgi:rubrerythrin
MKRLRRYLREVQEFDSSMERLNELFIQAAEINSMPDGRKRDIQMLRLAIIAEFDAANLYELMADLTSVPELKKLFMDISNEEKVHIGEFEFALEHLDPSHEENEDEGEDEAEDVTGWKEEETEENTNLSEVETSTLSAPQRKAKLKNLQNANKIRCKSIVNEINKHRENIKALLLQARQWGCGE